MLAPSENNEKDLLLQVAQGHEKAFAQLFHRYHHSLGIYIYQLTSSRELTEELVQDVFLKIWTNRQSLVQVENFEAWLFVITRNHTLNCLRKLVRERMEQKEWRKLQDPEFFAAGAPDEEQFQLIDQAIRQLPPQQKKVFILSRYRRLKYEEIAQELNLSRETVKSYLQIATSSITKFVTSRFSLIFWFFLPPFL